MRTRLAAAIAVVLATGASRPAAAQTVSPGPLARAHEHLEGVRSCTQCHELGKGVSSARCLACHDEIGKRLETNRGWHAVVAGSGKKGCAECHPDHAGREAALAVWPEDDRARFPHAEVWALEGKHATLDCSKCHEPAKVRDELLRKKRGPAGTRTLARSFLGLDTTCTSCHADPHAGASDPDCRRCHDATSWTVRAFDHARTEFPLTGAHVNVRCTACHDGRTTGIRTPATPAPARREAPKSFKPVSHESCTSCHQDRHEGRLGKNCRACHDDVLWKPAYYDPGVHPKLPLTGAHGRTACVACHGERLEKPLAGATCTTCHKTPHVVAFGVDCARCHADDGWASAALKPEQHGLTGWALDGKHFPVACAACHGTRPAPAPRAATPPPATAGAPGPASAGLDRPEGEETPRRSLILDLAMGRASRRTPAADAEALALLDALLARDPRNPEALFERARVLARRGDEASRARVRELLVEAARAGFLVLRELRRPDADPALAPYGKEHACVVALLRAPEGATVEPREVRNPFLPPRRAAPPVPDETRPALELRIEVLLRENELSTRGLSSLAPVLVELETLLREHVRLAPDEGASRRAGWRRRLVRLSEPGEHARRPLVEPSASAAPTAARRDERHLGVLKPISHGACSACHADAHRGELARSPDRGACERCHDARGFAPARYDRPDHARTTFALAGAHAAVACAGCHALSPAALRAEVAPVASVAPPLARAKLAPVRLKPSASTCGSCHADPHRGQYGPKPAEGRCDACHDVDRYRPARPFDHAGTRFPLAGKHATAACVACHAPPPPGGRATPAGTACTSCHRDPHLGQFARGEHDRRRACTDCHAEDRPFAPASPFAHDRTRFALDGKHAALACGDCHRTVELGQGLAATLYRPLPATCAGCHVDQHDRKPWTLARKDDR